MTNSTYPVSIELLQNARTYVKSDIAVTLTLERRVNHQGEYDFSVFHADSLYFIGTTAYQPDPEQAAKIASFVDDDDDDDDDDIFNDLIRGELGNMIAKEEEQKARQRVKVTRNEISAYVPTKSVWLPGDYFLLVHKKDDWVLKIEFQIDDQLVVWPTDQYFCNRGSLEHELASKLVYRKEWMPIATCPGGKELRQRYIKKEQLETLNEVRAQGGYKRMGFPRTRVGNQIIVCQGPKDLTQPIEVYARQIMGKGVRIYDTARFYNPASNNPYEDLSDLDALGASDLCLHNIGTLMNTGGKVITAKIEEKLREGMYNLLLLATEQELEQLFEVSPSMKDFFLEGSRVKLHDASCFELVQQLFGQIDKQEHRLSPLASDLLVRTLITAYERGNTKRWTGSDLKRYVLEGISLPFAERLLQQQDEGMPVMEMVKPEDIDTERLLTPGQTGDEVLARLNEMVGLTDVKQSITTMTNRMRFYAERRRLGLHTSDEAPHHAIFTGNPGTGKTTVARLLGKIYHSLGLLSKGDVVCVDRQRMVGRYIGETEENMKQILTEARGNVLFVDEAYTLYSSDGSNDFGRHALNSLLPVLAQKNSDVLIIFAGYEKEMDALMSMNPGLLGRFPYKFRFADYNADELMQIAKVQLERDEYVLTPEAADRLKKAIRDTVSHRTRNFANARWVEQLVQNGILPAMADRLAASKTAASREAYQLIERQDVEAAYQRFSMGAQELSRRVSIGFCA